MSEDQIVVSNLLTDLRSDLKSPAFAAAFLNTTTGTLAVWRCTKRYPLRFVRVGRKIMYRIRDLEAFIEARTMSGTVEDHDSKRG
jgi:Helix-turn-helix domain